MRVLFLSIGGGAGRSLLRAILPPSNYSISRLLLQGAGSTSEGEARERADSEVLPQRGLIRALDSF